MIASIDVGSTSRRRMFSTTPSGLTPASKRTWCSEPFLVTVTSAEKPCSATSASGPSPPSMILTGLRARDPPGGLRAGPWSGMKLSVTLSINVVTVTASTGSRSNTTPGSKSCSTCGPAGCWCAAGVWSVHMAVPPRGAGMVPGQYWNGARTAPGKRPGGGTARASGHDRDSPRLGIEVPSRKPLLPGPVRRLLRAAEQRVEVHSGRGRVNPDHPGVERVRQTQRPAKVLGEQGGDQPIPEYRGNAAACIGFPGSAPLDQHL